MKSLAASGPISGKITTLSPCPYLKVHSILIQNIRTIPSKGTIGRGAKILPDYKRKEGKIGVVLLSTSSHSEGWLERSKARRQGEWKVGRPPAAVVALLKRQKLRKSKQENGCQEFCHARTGKLRLSEKPREFKILRSTAKFKCFEL